MSKAAKLEYIWLDGFEPTQSLRSKTLIRNKFSGKLKDCPDWSFDGSSTRQAEGNDSDCILKPVAIYTDPDRKNGYLVMNEVYNADGTPHATNARATIDDDDNDFCRDDHCFCMGDNFIDDEGCSQWSRQLLQFRSFSSIGFYGHIHHYLRGFEINAHTQV